VIRNLTLAIEDDLLLEARKIALERRTTVNQMVREYLATLVDRESRVRKARSNLQKAFKRGIVEVGDRTWKREDLYER
jgi:Family of unknown function (DUF6364)